VGEFEAKSMPEFAQLQSIDSDLLSQRSVSLQVLRLDSLYPQWSGNKYFKLKNNIEQAKTRGFTQLLSFGGAFSNHIHALALAGKVQGLTTIGMIRGEAHSPLNTTLQDAVNAGMQLHYLSRADYRRSNDADFLAQLQRDFPNAFIIPEGGSNRWGVEGCKDIVSHIQHHCGDQFDVIAVPCGTAATLAGISAAAEGKQLWGFAVLKNAGYLKQEVQRFHAEIGFSGPQNWTLFDQYHCGGYAKLNQQLIAFMDDFYAANAIALEPVYTAKMFYGLFQLLAHSPERFRPVEAGKKFRIVAIHTGGLQGLRGMQTAVDKLRKLALA
jgi:1-aminocyclopropane-1-carboxylate deaminase